MDNSPISISEALNSIQSWLNAKEYDNAIQGCGEILEIEPGNQRALALMRLAEEKRHEMQNEPEDIAEDESQVVPATPSHEPDIDPLASLQVEKSPSVANPFEQKEPMHIEKRKLFLAMLLPAIAVVVLGGSTIWFMSIKDRTELIENSITTLPTEDRTYLEENETRVSDLSKMGDFLKKYENQLGAYPKADEMETALMESGLFTKVPSDPRSGEIDKAGKEFGYVYAVYDGIAGDNSVYILSALFEDSKGFGYPWTVGESIKNYASYRDVEGNNVTFVGSKEK
ncbi:MAG: hypothetical protein WC897_02155 [Candidatus Gracilibacteria bacterium]